MTRKDYVLIAAAIKAELAATATPHHATVKHLAIRIADVFAADNGRFDRQWFMTACGF